MKNNYWKFIVNFIYWTVICFLLLIAGILTISSFNLSNNISLYTVQSGSMEPTIKVGSLIIVRPQTTYKKGDIITFKSEAEKNLEKPKHPTTHRIYDIKITAKDIYFVTKGDFNKIPDTQLTKKDLVIGKVILDSLCRISDCLRKNFSRIDRTGCYSSNYNHLFRINKY